MQNSVFYTYNILMNRTPIICNLFIYRIFMRRVCKSYKIQGWVKKNLTLFAYPTSNCNYSGTVRRNHLKFDVLRRKSPQCNGLRTYFHIFQVMVRIFGACFIFTVVGVVWIFKSWHINKVNLEGTEGTLVITQWHVVSTLRNSSSLVW